TSFSRDWSSDVCSSDLGRIIQCRAFGQHGLVKQELRPFLECFIFGLTHPREQCMLRVDLENRLDLRGLLARRAQHPLQMRAEFRSEEHTSELQSREKLV